MNKTYYVFSAYCENAIKYQYGDYHLMSDEYPKKSELKQIVKDYCKIAEPHKIVIMGITPMTPSEFKRYWEVSNE